MNTSRRFENIHSEIYESTFHKWYHFPTLICSIRCDNVLLSPQVSCQGVNSNMGSTGNAILPLYEQLGDSSNLKDDEEEKKNRTLRRRAICKEVSGVCSMLA